ncbi:MAG: serine protease [Candidatus Bathyarchaeota archaeon]|nr:serine protease [Candidatus Bathyarchaeota archaeon]
MAAETSPLIRKIMRLYPDLTKAQQFFEKTETAYPIMFPIKHETLPLGIEKRKLMRMKTIEATSSALEKIKKFGELANLTPSENNSILCSIILTTRPAILIENDTYLQAKPPLTSSDIDWNNFLEPYRGMIEKAALSVGRIEFKHSDTEKYGGTGFLVAEDVIMTNRHVAEYFCEKDMQTGEYIFKTEITRKRIDYCEENNTSPSREFQIKKILKIYDPPDPDLALLKVAKTSQEREHPTPLVIADSMPDPIEDSDVDPNGHRKVFAVGYPFFDTRETTKQLQDVFGDVYEVKRLQPGIFNSVKNVDNVLRHDCSTIGGNSGSCIVDVKLNQVIGLHFRGELASEYNEAVALPLLNNSIKNDLKQFGVEFA